MAKPTLDTKRVKDNSRKKGVAQTRKEQRRKDAEERQLHYQSLSLEEKLKRNSVKVRAKLEINNANPT